MYKPPRTQKATQAEAEAGTETANREFSPETIAQAVAALAAGGGGIPGAIAYGHDWVWDSTTELRLVPFGHISPVATMTLVDAATETTYSTVELTSALTLDHTISGAGGLDTGSVSNGAFYKIYLIAKAGGADPVLITSLSAAGSVTLPANYVLISPREIWGWYASGGNFQTFICKDPGIGRSCRYGSTASNSSPTLLANSVLTGRQSVDFSAKVPSSTRTALIQIRASNTSSTSRNCTLYNSAAQGGQILQSFQSLGGAGAGDGNVEFMSAIVDLSMRRGLDDCFSYWWSGAPTGGIVVFLLGFDLG